MSLLVSKAVGEAVRLDWSVSCLATDTDYGVYEGPIGTFTAHVPVLCSTGGATTATIDPAAASTYYLVVPNTQSYEGRCGRASTGAETPHGPTRCYPAATTPGCP